MKRFLTKVFTYLLVTYVTASSIALGLDYSLTHSRFYKFYLNTQEENLKDAELLILGGSRAMVGFDSQTIEKETGLRSYNVGIDDTGIASHLLLLKLFWKRGIRPRYVILEYSNFNPRERWGWSNNDSRIMPLILSDRDVRSYIIENRGAAFAYAHMALPFFKYSYYNEELFFPAVYTLAAKQKAYRSDAHGDYSYPPEISNIETSGINAGQPITTETLNTSCLEYREFLHFAKSNGINVITVVAPIERKHLVTTEAGVVNYTYLDLPAGDFVDSTHVNSRGKEKISTRLAKLLKDRLAGVTSE